MSPLTNALDRIRAWLQINYPAGAKHVPPGLSIAEIEEIVQTLPFKVPHDVYELYQWSTGNSEESLTNYAFFFEPFDGMTLFSLERGIEVASTFDDEFEEVAIRYNDKPLFPIFGSDATNLCVIANWEQKESSPIIYVSELGEVAIWYISLTSMMLTIAECLETKVAYINAKGLLEYEKEKFSPIYRKHNFNLPELVLINFNQGLAIANLKSEMILRRKFWDNFLGNIYWLTRHWKDLSINQFAPKATEPILAALQDTDEGVRHRARQALEDLNYSF